MTTKAMYVETLANVNETHQKLRKALAEAQAHLPDAYVIAAFDSSLYIVKDDGRYWARFLTTEGLQLFSSKELADRTCTHFKQVFKDAEVVPYLDALRKQIDAIDTLTGLLDTAIGKAS